MSRVGENLQKVEIKSLAELRAWLQRHHAQRESVWLVTFKKAPRAPYVAYADIVDELLCFGWIDSLPRALDENRTMVRISPRNPKSAWSKINKDKAARLTKSGRMQPPGQAAIAAAKAKGVWAKLDAVETLTPPDDLARALNASPPAAEHFAAFPPSIRRGILEWITQAKRPETRARRIAETARLAARNERANQYRK